MHIGFLGAGSVARALGQLFRTAGCTVTFGTRQGIFPDVSLEEATHADVIIVAIPFPATRDVLPGIAEQLVGKVVIDATNPVNADWSPMLLGQENSAGEEVARLLPGARVVKAFNTAFADVMRADVLCGQSSPITCFVAGDDADACAEVSSLARSAGFGVTVVGPLKHARQLEAMAHLNIQIAVGMKGGTKAAFAYRSVS